MIVGERKSSFQRNRGTSDGSIASSIKSSTSTSSRKKVLAFGARGYMQHLPKAVRQEMELALEEDAETGEEEATFRLSLHDPAILPPPIAKQIVWAPKNPNARGFLLIHVLKAEGLPSMTYFNSSNPYIVLKYGDDECKTAIRKKTQVPVWDELFALGQISTVLKESEGVLFSCYHSDLISDAYIGSAFLKCTDIENRTIPFEIVLIGGHAPGISDGTRKGILKVKAFWTESVIKPSEPSTSRFTEPLLNLLDRYLRITVMGAENLPAVDFHSTISPFVKIVVGTKTASTASEHDTINPKWNENFAFEILPHDRERCEGVRFEIYDVGGLFQSDKCIGKVVLDWDSITDEIQRLVIQDPSGSPQTGKPKNSKFGTLVIRVHWVRAMKAPPDILQEEDQEEKCIDEGMGVSTEDDAVQGRRLSVESESLPEEAKEEEFIEERWSEDTCEDQLSTEDYSDVEQPPVVNGLDLINKAGSLRDLLNSPDQNLGFDDDAQVADNAGILQREPGDISSNFDEKSGLLEMTEEEEELSDQGNSYKSSSQKDQQSPASSSDFVEDASEEEHFKSQANLVEEASSRYDEPLFRDWVSDCTLDTVTEESEPDEEDDFMDSRLSVGYMHISSVIEKSDNEKAEGETLGGFYRHPFQSPNTSSWSEDDGHLSQHSLDQTLLAQNALDNEFPRWAMIAVIAADGLDAEGWNLKETLFNPYVRIRLLQTSEATGVKKQTKSPIWNQCFALEVSLLARSSCEGILLEVYHFDPEAAAGLGEDLCLGTSMIEWKTIASDEEALELTLQHAGKSWGTLYIKVAWHKGFDWDFQQGMRVIRGLKLSNYSKDAVNMENFKDSVPNKHLVRLRRRWTLEGSRAALASARAASERKSPSSIKSASAVMDFLPDSRQSLPLSLSSSRSLSRPFSSLSMSESSLGIPDNRWPDATIDDSEISSELDIKNVHIVSPSEANLKQHELQYSNGQNIFINQRSVSSLGMDDSVGSLGYSSILESGSESVLTPSNHFNMNTPTNQMISSNNSESPKGTTGNGDFTMSHADATFVSDTSPFQSLPFSNAFSNSDESDMETPSKSPFEKAFCDDFSEDFPRDEMTAQDLCPSDSSFRSQKQSSSDGQICSSPLHKNNLVDSSSTLGCEDDVTELTQQDKPMQRLHESRRSWRTFKDDQQLLIMVSSGCFDLDEGLSNPTIHILVGNEKETTEPGKAELGSQPLVWHWDQSFHFKVKALTFRQSANISLAVHACDAHGKQRFMGLATVQWDALGDHDLDLPIFRGKSLDLCSDTKMGSLSIYSHWKQINQVARKLMPEEDLVQPEKSKPKRPPPPSPPQPKAQQKVNPSESPISKPRRPAPSPQAKLRQVSNESPSAVRPSRSPPSVRPRRSPPSVRPSRSPPSVRPSRSPTSVRPTQNPPEARPSRSPPTARPSRSPPTARPHTPKGSPGVTLKGSQSQGQLTKESETNGTKLKHPPPPPPLMSAVADQTSLHAKLKSPAKVSLPQQPQDGNPLASLQQEFEPPTYLRYAKPPRRIEDWEDEHVSTPKMRVDAQPPSRVSLPNAISPGVRNSPNFSSQVVSSANWTSNSSMSSPKAVLQTPDYEDTSCDGKLFSPYDHPEDIYSTPIDDAPQEAPEDAFLTPCNQTFEDGSAQSNFIDLSYSQTDSDEESKTEARFLKDRIDSDNTEVGITGSQSSYVSSNASTADSANSEDAQFTPQQTTRFRKGHVQNVVKQYGGGNENAAENAKHLVRKSAPASSHPVVNDSSDTKSLPSLNSLDKDIQDLTPEEKLEERSRLLLLINPEEKLKLEVPVPLRQDSFKGKKKKHSGCNQMGLRPAHNASFKGGVESVCGSEVSSLSSYGGERRPSISQMTHLSWATHRSDTSVPKFAIVQLLGATALPVMDLFGKCDPYVKVILGDHMAVSDVKKVTLTPVWNRLYGFKISKEEKSAIPGANFEVWNHNMFGNHEFIGQSLLAWRDFTGIAKDLPILGGPKPGRFDRTVQGTLRVCACWAEGIAEDFSQGMEERQHLNRMLEQGVGGKNNQTKEYFGLFSPKHFQPRNSSLAPCASEAKRTFDFPEIMPVVPEQSLLPDNLLQEHIFVESPDEEDQIVWRRPKMVRLKQSNRSPFLKKKVTSQSATQTSPDRLLAKENSAEQDGQVRSEDQLPEPYLLLTFLKGRHLPRMDIIGLCDAYVIARLGDQNQKTKVIKNSLNPVWNQTLILEVTPNDKLRQLGIVCEVYDWEMFGRHGYIGQVKLEWQIIESGKEKLFHISRGSMPGHLNGSRQGLLRIRMDWADSMETAQKIMQSICEQQKQEKERRAQNHAALKIQGAFQKMMLDKAQAELDRQQYSLEVQDRAATIIQQAYFYHLEKSVMEQMRDQARLDGCATKVQALYRGHLARRFTAAEKQLRLLLKMEAAATIIQRSHRKYCAKKTLANLKDRKAATRLSLTLQRLFRGYKGRVIAKALRQKAIEHKAAIIIQRNFIMHVFRQVLRFLVQTRRQDRAARLIQRVYRGHNGRWIAFELKQHLEYEKELAEDEQNAAILIQCAVRCMIARDEYHFRYQYHHAALKIQKIYRGALGREKAHITRVKLYAAVHVQSILRGFLSRRATRERQAARKIQLAYRALCAFRVLKSLRDKNAAAKASVVIQCYWRRFSAQKWVQCLRNRQILRASAIRIQSNYRGSRARWLAGKLRRRKQRLLAAVTIQCCWRRHVARRKKSILSDKQRRQFASKKIQGALRIHVAKCKLWKLKRARQRLEASFLLQRAWRCYIARKTLMNYKLQAQRNNAAITLQCGARTYLARKECWRRNQIWEQNWAAKVLARAFKILEAKKRLLALQTQRHERMAAIKIQSTFRTFRATRSFQFQKNQIQGAIKIQACYRMFQARNAATSQKKRRQRSLAATTLQSTFRMHQARKNYLFVQKNRRNFKSATTIQTAFRGYKAKKLVALRLSNNARIAAAVKIQSAFRAHRAKNACRTLLEKKRWNDAAIQIQVVARVFLAKNMLAARKLKRDKWYGSIKIQTLVRSFLAKRRLRALQLRRNKRAAAIKIQSLVRVHKCRKELKYRRTRAKRELAAKTVQRAARGHQGRQLVRSLRQTKARQDKDLRRRSAVFEGVVTIQRMWRGWLGRKKTAYLRWTLEMANGEQERLKKAHSILKIQKVVRGFLGRREFAYRRTVILAVIKLQSCVRGHLARLTVGEIVAMAALETVQRVVRGFLCRRRIRKLRQVVASAVKDQAQKEAAAVCIQRVGRGRRSRRRFQLVKNSVLNIQRVYRGHLIRRALGDLTLCALSIQRFWRYHTRRQQQQLQDEILTGVVKLQAAIRGAVWRQRFAQGVWAVRVIQRRHRLWRLIYVIKNAGFLKGMMKLQALVRGHLGRKRFEEVRVSMLPADLLIDHVLQSCTAVKRLYLGNKKTLYKIFKCYIVYPEQTMTETTILQFTQHFHIMPDICLKRPVKEMVETLTWRNRSKVAKGKVLVSFEQFIKFLLLLAKNYAQAYIDPMKLHLMTAHDKGPVAIKGIAYKFSELLKFMDQYDGKKKCAQQRRIHEHLPKFILLDSQYLPAEDVAERYIFGFYNPIYNSPNANNSSSAASNSPRGGVGKSVSGADNVSLQSKDSRETLSADEPKDRRDSLVSVSSSKSRDSSLRKKSSGSLGRPRMTRAQELRNAKISDKANSATSPRALKGKPVLSPSSRTLSLKSKDSSHSRSSSIKSQSSALGSPRSQGSTNGTLKSKGSADLSKPRMTRSQELLLQKKKSMEPKTTPKAQGKKPSLGRVRSRTSSMKSGTGSSASPRASEASEESTTNKTPNLSQPRMTRSQELLQKKKSMESKTSSKTDGKKPSLGRANTRSSSMKSERASSGSPRAREKSDKGTFKKASPDLSQPRMTRSQELLQKKKSMESKTTPKSHGRKPNLGQTNTRTSSMKSDKASSVSPRSTSKTPVNITQPRMTRSQELLQRKKSMDRDAAQKPNLGQTNTRTSSMKSDKASSVSPRSTSKTPVNITQPRMTRSQELLQRKKSMDRDAAQKAQARKSPANRTGSMKAQISSGASEMPSDASMPSQESRQEKSMDPESIQKSQQAEGQAVSPRSTKTPKNMTKPRMTKAQELRAAKTAESIAPTQTQQLPTGSPRSSANRKPPSSPRAQARPEAKPRMTRTAQLRQKQLEKTKASGKGRF